MIVSGSRIVVTGASRGIGEQLARALAAKGARVVLVARSADAIAKLAADLGGEAHPADLADATAIDTLVAAIERDGAIDALVNNAGVDLTGRFTTMDPVAIEQLITLNLVAPMLLARAVLPGMLERRAGTILNVGSMAGVSALPGLVAYNTSKAGLAHFSASLRAELRGTPIVVSLAELGGIESEMWDNVRSHGPTTRTTDRLAKLQLLPTLPMATVVAALVAALERDRKHLRMPLRDYALPMIGETPRRIIELLLTGVDHQSD
jgi:short-subunit dehydrogenase